MMFYNQALTAAAVAVSIEEKPRKQRNSAVWTMLGTMFALGTFAAMNHGFSDFWRILEHLLAGDANMAQLHSGHLVRMAPVVAAMVVINLALMAPVGVLVAKTVKIEEGKDRRGGMFQTEKPKQQYGKIMVILLFEELFARGLFLGIIGHRISWFDHSNTAFYLLFFAGNGLWAAVHLGNLYKEGESFPIKKKYQMLLCILPQFVGGILITAVYLPFGLVGALIAHVIFDMVLFASDRVDVFDGGEKLLIAYHTLVGGAATLYFVFVSHRNIGDMKAWLHEGVTSFALPGWHYWDYASAVVMLTSGVVLGLEVLLYDREGGEEKSEFLKDLGFTIMFALSAYAIVKGALGMTYLPMGGIVIALSILSVFFVRTRSGSGVARLFWEATLIGSVVIGTLLAMDERHGLYLMALLALLWLPDRIIRHLDTDELPEDDDDETDDPDDDEPMAAKARPEPSIVSV